MMYVMRKGEIVQLPPKTIGQSKATTPPPAGPSSQPDQPIYTAPAPAKAVEKPVSKPEPKFVANTAELGEKKAPYHKYSPLPPEENAVLPKPVSTPKFVAKQTSVTPKPAYSSPPDVESEFQKPPEQKYVMRQEMGPEPEIPGPAAEPVAKPMASGGTEIRFAEAPVFVDPKYTKVHPNVKSVLDTATQGLSLPKGLFLGIIRQESGFNPAIKGRDPGGSIGYGLGQLTEGGKSNTPGFWAKYAKKNLGISNFNILDPEHNAKVSAHYLNNLYNSYGKNPWLAAVAYNQGSGNLNKTLKRAGIDPDSYGSLGYDDVMNILRKTGNKNGIRYLSDISRWTGTKV